MRRLSGWAMAQIRLARRRPSGFFRRREARALRAFLLGLPFFLSSPASAISRTLSSVGSAQTDRAVRNGGGVEGYLAAFFTCMARPKGRGGSLKQLALPPVR